MKIHAIFLTFFTFSCTYASHQKQYSDFDIFTGKIQPYTENWTNLNKKSRKRRSYEDIENSVSLELKTNSA